MHAEPDSTSTKPASNIGLEQLRRWLNDHDRIFVLTGAGVSTGSGIPDYRDRDGEWKRKPPVTIQQFTGDPDTYRRYWARSSLGWPRFSAAKPNAAHHALVRLEQSERLSLLVTQNVDALHQRAGSSDVIDLHGRLDDVVCLGCGHRQARDAVQHALREANADWRAEHVEMAPDGDADIDDAVAALFVAPCCPLCGAMVKPDVVFFGENVPRARFERARDALAASDAMLVAGSSLMVYSGFRFARMAHEKGLQVAIVNAGLTRADELASLKIEEDVGSALAYALSDD